MSIIRPRLGGSPGLLRTIEGCRLKGWGRLKRRQGQPNEGKILERTPIRLKIEARLQALQTKPLPKGDGGLVKKGGRGTTEGLGINHHVGSNR